MVDGLRSGGPSTERPRMPDGYGLPFTEEVLVEGTSHAARAEVGALGPRLAEAFGEYRGAGYAPGPGAWAGEDGGALRVLVPRRALAWSSFPQDATRFTSAG